jgi:hypothetical protein
LVVASFSYWQDTGLADYPVLPIGYGQTIISPDFQSTEFFPDLNKTDLNKDGLEILHFKIHNEKLCAEISHENSNSPNFDFIIYDLPDKTYQTFKSEREYIEYAQKNGFPLKQDFSDFNHQYDDYLNNRPEWERLLLPR